MNNLGQRIITGTLFVSLLIFSISYNEYTAAGLFLIFSTLGTIEFYKILNTKKLSNNTKYGPIVNILVYTIVTLASLELVSWNYLVLIIPLLLILVVQELFDKEDIPYQNISSTLFALLYITLPFAALNYIGFNVDLKQNIELTSGANILLGFFIILWTSDSMAYVVGRLIGRKKLIPRVSPGKTWEGLFGGIIFSLLAGFIFAYFTNSSILHWIVMALIISIFGTLGDLSESLLKRSAGVKDSGTLLPGHGGVLDRFDGILFSAPLVLTYLIFI